MEILYLILGYTLLVAFIAVLTIIIIKAIHNSEVSDILVETSPSLQTKIHIKKYKRK